MAAFVTGSDVKRSPFLKNVPLAISKPLPHFG